MEEYNRYDAMAGTMKIEDITSDKTNAKFLRQLKSNDPSFDVMWLYDCHEDEFDYSPSSDEEFGLLGYFIGKNTQLRELGIGFSESHGKFELNEMKRFSRGLIRNKFIQKISFLHIDLADGELLKMLDPFFKNNHNLAEISVDTCEFGAGSARVLSVILGGCNKSLKRINLEGNAIGEGQVVDVVVALSMHPQLEKLEVKRTNIGRNECMAIATLLRWTTTKLHTLVLSNRIDDDGVDALVDALASSDLLHTLNLSYNNISDNGVKALMRALANGKLRELDLSNNRSITVRGWQSVASLLDRNPNLEVLNFCNNNVDDEGALVFANALVNNSKLKTLDTGGSYGNNITAQGWSAFSKVLCDTSSVNKTFLSNHTLQRLCDAIYTRALPQDVKSYLELNGSSEDKKKIAVTKILQHHSDFNMKPLFEWEFKALPVVIGWCERASACTTTFESKIGRVKLSSIYQFVREMPVMYVEARTRQELEAIRAMKMRLQWEQLELASKLEEVERREARAMGRL